MSGDIFSGHNFGRGSYKDSMAAGQGCCQAQHSPTTENHPTPNANSAETEKQRLKDSVKLTMLSIITTVSIY